MARRPQARFDITADDKTRATLERVNRRLGNITKTAGLAALGLVGAFAAISKTAIKMGDDIAKSAKRAGLGAETFQEWRFAATQAGATSEEFGKAMEFANKAIGQSIIGSNEAKAVFEKMGISLFDVGGNVRSTEAILRDFSGGLENIRSTAERAGAEAFVFGRSGLAVGQAFEKGAKALDEAGVKAREFGLVIDQDVLAAAEKAADRLDIMSTALSSQLLVSLRDVIPLMGQLALKTAGAAVEFTKFIGFIAGAEGFAKTADDLADVNQQIADVQEKIEFNRGAGAPGTLGAVLGLETQENLMRELNDLIERQIALKQRLSDITRADLSTAPGSNGKGGGGLTPINQKTLDSAQKLFASLKVLKLQALGDEEELDRIKFDKLKEKLEAEKRLLIDKGLFTEELEAAHFEALADLDIVRKEAALEREREFLEAERDLMLEFEELRVEAEEAANEEILAKRRRVFAELGASSTDLAKLEEGNIRGKTEFAISQAISLSAGLAQTNKKAFQINKALSIGEAVMSTAAGIARAFQDWPFPASAGVAALVGASGAVQIAAIQATQFGGGAARGGGALSGIPSVAGGTTQQPGAPQDIDIPEIQQNEAREQNVVITIRGDGGGVSFLRALIDDISAELEEGGGILVPLDSRNALELMDPLNR